MTLKILIAYLTISGNTKKVAEAIFQAIDCSDKAISEIKQVRSLEGYDLVFVGFPIHGFGQPPEEAKEFLRQNCLARKIAIFITHSAPEKSPFVKGWIENCKIAAFRAEIIGFFDCQGQISKGQLETMLNNPNPRVQEIGRKVAISSNGQPDENRLIAAGNFARDVVSKIKPV